MTRKLLFLAAALTLIVAGSALAQQTQSYPPTSTTTAQTTPSDQATTDPAATPATETPATTADQTSTMPATASPMPLVGMTGVSLLLAAFGLTLRRRLAR